MRKLATRLSIILEILFLLQIIKSFITGEFIHWIIYNLFLIVLCIIIILFASSGIFREKCKKCGSKKLDCWWEEGTVKVTRCKDCDYRTEKEMSKKANKCERCRSSKIKIWSEGAIRYRQCMKCGHTLEKENEHGIRKCEYCGGKKFKSWEEEKIRKTQCLACGKIYSSNIHYGGAKCEPRGRYRNLT